MGSSSFTWFFVVEDFTLLQSRISMDGDVFGWHDEKREDLVDCRRLAIDFSVELRMPPDTRFFFQRCKKVFLNSYVENKVLGGPELMFAVIPASFMRDHFRTKVLKK